MCCVSRSMGKFWWRGGGFLLSEANPPFAPVCCINDVALLCLIKQYEQTSFYEAKVPHLDVLHCSSSITSTLTWLHCLTLAIVATFLATPINKVNEDCTQFTLRCRYLNKFQKLHPYVNGVHAVCADIISHLWGSNWFARDKWLKQSARSDCASTSYIWQTAVNAMHQPVSKLRRFNIEVGS